MKPMTGNSAGLLSAAIAAATMALAGSRPARAQAQLPGGDSFRSPQRFAFELRFGPYRPDVDAEFAGGAGPHRRFFGDDARVLSQLQLDYQIFSSFGTLALGVGAGRFKESANAFVETGPGTIPDERTADRTSLTMYPLSLQLVYRFDALARRTGLPLVPYGKIGLAYALWTIRDGNGNVAKTESPRGRGRGGTRGWLAGAGLAFQLDVLDPGAARELDAQTGVNHTYLFAEWTRHDLSGLGQEGALHLGDTTWSAGLLFEF